jgi:hypothetical protein
MKTYADGPYLRAFSGFLEESAGTKSKGAVRIAGLVNGSYSSEELTLVACEDGRKVLNYDKDGDLVGPGAAAVLTLKAKPVKDRWIIWDGDDEAVKSCTDG